MSGFRFGLNEATKDCFEGSSPRSKVSNLSFRASSLVPPRSGEMEMLEDELDELRSEAALITPRPRPRPTPRPAAVAPPLTVLDPCTPLPPGIGLLGVTRGLPADYFRIIKEK